jgi:hypothetical protein
VEIEKVLKLKEKKKVEFLMNHVVGVDNKRKDQYQYNQDKIGLRKRDDNILWLSNCQFSQSQRIEDILS